MLTIAFYHKKLFWVLHIGLFCLRSLLISPNDRPVSVKKIDLSGFAQGTTWHVTYFANDSIVVKKHVDSILLVIDSSLSIYKPFSKIVAFNNSATGLTLDEHFRRVVEKSLDTYDRTNGIFDITVLPLVEAWGFGAKSTAGLPDSSTINSLLTCVGSYYLRLDGDRLTKLKTCVKIDVNGIAQGYSVDVLAGFLESKGVRNYIIELGGEVRVLGKKQPGNEPLKIGIESPPDNEFISSSIKKIIVFDSGAITTSGNYRKYYESGGKKISHLIDPRTGYSATNEIISVTVYASDAITADAYDNALMIMGLEKAMQFVETRSDLAAYFIYRLPNGNIADTSSAQFRKLVEY